MTRELSSGLMIMPVSLQGCPVRSTHKCRSGLSIISTTSGSSKNGRIRPSEDLTFSRRGRFLRPAVFFPYSFPSALAVSTFLRPLPLAAFFSSSQRLIKVSPAILISSPAPLPLKRSLYLSKSPARMPLSAFSPRIFQQSRRFQSVGDYVPCVPGH